MAPAPWSNRALTCLPGGNISAEAGTSFLKKGLTAATFNYHYQCEDWASRAQAAERDGAWVAVTE